jgi:DUF917 family protein
MSEGRLTQITITDVPALARGCAVLGTGGGGEVESGALIALSALQASGPVPLVTLDDLPDQGLVLPLSGIGAPTVGHEMMHGVEEPFLVRDAVEQALGAPVVAVMSSEIGGSNGVAPVGWAAQLGLPLVDGDGMGRAFPEVQMVSMNVAGIPIENIALADVIGNVTFLRPTDWEWAETISRAVSVAAGSYALMADNVITAGRMRGAIVEDTVSQAVRIGRATEGVADPVEALRAELGAARLITGKVIEVERRTGGGFVRGSVVIDGMGTDTGRVLRIEIQNENLVVFEDGQVLASVPDLISVIDIHTAGAIATELLRYGQRVCVMAWPCADLWRTPRGLEVVGPRAFGYDLDYIPVEEAAHAFI